MASTHPVIHNEHLLCACPPTRPWGCTSEQDRPTPCPQPHCLQPLTPSPPTTQDQPARHAPSRAALGAPHGPLNTQLSPLLRQAALGRPPPGKAHLAPAPSSGAEDMFRGPSPASLGVEAGGATGRQEQFASVDKCRRPLLRSESPFLFSLPRACSLSLFFFFFFFLQFAKSVVIWCQRLIQAEGGNGEQKTRCHRAAPRESAGSAPRPPQLQSGPTPPRAGGRPPPSRQGPTPSPRAEPAAPGPGRPPAGCLGPALCLEGSVP